MCKFHHTHLQISTYMLQYNVGNLNLTFPYKNLRNVKSSLVPRLQSSAFQFLKNCQKQRRD